MVARRGGAPYVALALWLLVLLADAVAGGATALVAAGSTALAAGAVLVVAARLRAGAQPVPVRVRTAPARLRAARLSAVRGIRPPLR